MRLKKGNCSILLHVLQLILNKFQSLSKMSYNQNNRKKHKNTDRYISNNWERTEKYIKYFVSLVSLSSKWCFTKSLQTSSAQQNCTCRNSFCCFHLSRVQWVTFLILRDFWHVFQSFCFRLNSFMLHISSLILYKWNKNKALSL